MKALCINIDERTDRWEQASHEFTRWGLNVQRVSAIVGDNRPLAFNQSVYKCMNMAKGDDLLLFEDDVVIEAPIKINWPGDYLTIHLGANIIGMDTTDWQMPTYHCPSMAKLYNCWQSHATIYSKEAVDFILKNLDPTVLDEDNNIFDDWLRRKVLHQGRSYVLRPMIAYQRPSRSDIWNCESDYTGCHKQGNEYLLNKL